MTYSLPKWPQMLVWGQLVSKEQAEDIITRTDVFLSSVSTVYGGNNHSYNEWVRRTLGFSRILEKIETLLPKSEWNLRLQLELWAETQIKEFLQVVETGYVKNSWTSCSFIYGSHGWCHPDGTICFVDNIGKYPEFEEVKEDWEKIAKAFPYLNLKVTLMSGESCEDDIQPVVTLVVSDAQVSVLQTPILPDQDPSIEYWKWTRSNRNTEYIVSTIFNTTKENLTPEPWIVRLSEKLNPVVDSILSNMESELKTIKT